MIEETLDINTADGQMETFICRPERGGPYPAVFFLMDAPGIREELKDMTRRLATVGYYVLLPNLYYRAGRDTLYGPDVLTEGSAEHQRMRAPDDIREGRHACVCRSREGSCRLPRLYERPYALYRSRCGRLVLRHLAGQRCGGESASLFADHRRADIACAEHDDAPPSMKERKSCSPVRSSCTPGCITASPFPSAGVTTNRPQSDIGNGSWRSIGGGLMRHCADKLKVCPMTQIIFLIDPPGVDPRDMRSSLTLLAKEVIPHFRSR